MKICLRGPPIDEVTGYCVRLYDLMKTPNPSSWATKGLKISHSASMGSCQTALMLAAHVTKYVFPRHEPLKFAKAYLRLVVNTFI